MSKETRKIVAILFSDVVGHTTQTDDERTEPVGAISRTREVQRELVERYHGEWLRELGDGALCTFDAAPRALGCALEIQRAFGEEPKASLRIGIHLGDLVFRTTETGTDVFGDSVVVAARVQGVAAAGGICVSDRVFEALPRNVKGLEFNDLGEQQLKSVNRPVKVYEVVEPRGEAAAELMNAMDAVDEPPRAWLLPLVGIIVAASLAVIAALWVSRSESPNPSEGIELAAVDEAAAAAEAARQQEVARLAAFVHARKALLELDGEGLDARVWTIPDPVKNEGVYQVGFEAACSCSALLFAVNGATEEIALLYPNNFEARAQITSGEAMQIPSSPAWTLRAVGGEGIDVLKLIVVDAELGFPGALGEPWIATPDLPERVEELRALLESIDALEWDAATAPLQITP